MCQLLQVIGSKFLQKQVFNDGRTIQSKYKDSEYLPTLNSNQFIKERNQLVVSFISACANIRIEDQKNENFICAVGVAVEMIYYLRDPNIIPPHCFFNKSCAKFCFWLENCICAKPKGKTKLWLEIV